MGLSILQRQHDMPVVKIVVGGDVAVIKRIADALDKGAKHLFVLMEGSGGAADILACALK